LVVPDDPKPLEIDSLRDRLTYANLSLPIVTQENGT
jgi:hypothetical protein